MSGQIIRVLSWLLGVLPLRVSYALSGLVALGMYVFWRRGRENALKSLRHVLGPGAPEAQVRRTARRTMRNFCRVAVEFLRLPRMSQAEIARIVREPAQGEEHVLALRGSGRGILVVALHFGNWDFSALWSVARGFPLYMIVDDYGNSSLDAEFREARTRQGIQVIPVGLTVRRVYRLLKEGNMVAVALDVPTSPDKGGIPVRFFDGTIMAPSGPARLALRTGAAVLSGVCARQPDNSFKVWVKPPIEIQPSGDEERDVRALTQAIARECEDFVRQYPDQWYIFRPIWLDAPTAPGQEK